MADITPLALDSALTLRDFISAAGAGDKIVQPGGAKRMLLVFQNTNASSRTVTITAQETGPVVASFGKVTVADKVLALAQNKFGFVEIPKAGFNNTADADKVAITYSSEVGVTLLAFWIP